MTTNIKVHDVVSLLTASSTDEMHK